MTYGLDLGELRGTIRGSMPYPAGMLRRVVGFVIDVAAYLVLVYEAAVFVLLAGMKGEVLGVEGGGDLLRVTGPLAMFGPLAVFMLRDLTVGRSLGKWLTGMRVIESDAAVEVCPSWWRLVLRQVTVAVLPAEVVVAVVGTLAGLVVRGASSRWWGQGRRLGDVLAGTLVVEEIPAGETRWVGWLGKGLAALVVFMALLTMTSSVQMATVRHLAGYETAAEFVRTSAELEKLVGGGAGLGYQVKYSQLAVAVPARAMEAEVKGNKGEVRLLIVVEGEKGPGQEGPGKWRVVAGFYRQGSGQMGELVEGISPASAEVAKVLEESRQKRKTQNAQ